MFVGEDPMPAALAQPCYYFVGIKWSRAGRNRPGKHGNSAIPGGAPSLPPRPGATGRAAERQYLGGIGQRRPKN
jgi:hypothetical protein